MSNETQAQVQFTKQQYEYLNRLFPEMVGDATTTTDAMRFRSGQRSVLARIRLNVQQSAGDKYGTT